MNREGNFSRPMNHPCDPWMRCGQQYTTLGRQFCAGLRRPMPTAAPKVRAIRVVPAFTPLSRQKGTVVEPPFRSNFRSQKPPKPSTFLSLYRAGTLPFNAPSGGSRILWKYRIEDVDFEKYLPVAFDGLREPDMKCRALAHRAVIDMLLFGRGRVLPVLPQIIMPMKHALNTRNAPVMKSVMKIMQLMVQHEPMLGEALVPYYRQLLPMFNMFRDVNVNCWDALDNSEPLGDVIEKTLHVLEQNGGEDAFINIKYMIPTYESCMYN